MADNLLETKKVSYSVGSKTLIDNVDCVIAPARCTLVLGANGAGKSLLLRLFHGLIRPTQGSIHWRDKIFDRSARRRQSMVFQRPVMLRRSVRANLEFALQSRGLSSLEISKQVEAELAHAELDHIATRPARVLSGGETQRLALARALITRPDMILLDEPTASLDPKATHSIEALIKEAVRNGVAVVMVTHSPGQARRLADEVIFLHTGRVIEAGPADVLLNRPQSIEAQAWLDGGLVL